MSWGLHVYQGTQGVPSLRTVIFGHFAIAQATKSIEDQIQAKAGRTFRPLGEARELFIFAALQRRKRSAPLADLRKRA